MSALILRVEPSSPVPALSGNLGAVVANDALTTLRNLQALFASFNVGSPAVALVNGRIVEQTISLRCDVDPVAPTAALLLADGDGAISVTLNGVVVSVAYNVNDELTTIDLANAVNASTNPLIKNLITAVASSQGPNNARVDFTGIGSGRSAAGNAFTIAGSGTGVSIENSATRFTGGTDGTAQVDAAPASGSFTFNSASGTVTASVGGVIVSLESTGNDTDDALALRDLFANTPGIQALVIPSAALGVVTVTARLPGTAGNAITTSATGTNFAADQTHLSGGLNKFQTYFTY